MGNSKNPFRGFIDTISETNRMREHWMTGYDPNTSEERTHANAWVPTTDIYAIDNDLVIRCELAGVVRDDLDITLSNRVLTIYGERTIDHPEDVTYYAHERHHGHFRRSMTLPEGTREEDLEAVFKDGMLEVVIKGGAATQEPSQINIGTGES